MLNSKQTIEVNGEVVRIPDRNERVIPLLVSIKERYPFSDQIDDIVSFYQLSDEDLQHTLQSQKKGAQISLTIRKPINVAGTLVLSFPERDPESIELARLLTDDALNWCELLYEDAAGEIGKYRREVHSNAFSNDTFIRLLSSIKNKFQSQTEGGGSPTW